MIEVSIIIINYNTYKLTCDCVQSVIDNSIDIDYEIILVDNASIECNPDLFIKRFENITLVKSKVNHGFAGGNNIGLQYAKGENILLLNSDTILIENSVKFIFNKGKEISNLGAATIKIIYPGGKIQPAANKFPSTLAHFLQTTRLRKVFKKVYKQKRGNYDYSCDFPTDWIWGTFFYFPKKNLQYMNGKLSETYFMYSEDVEWCYNFKKHNLQNYYFSGSEIIHYGGKSSSSGFKNKLFLQNYFHFIKFNYGLGYYLIERLLFMFDELEWRIRFGRRVNSKY